MQLAAENYSRRRGGPEGGAGGDGVGSGRVGPRVTVFQPARNLAPLPRGAGGRGEETGGGGEGTRPREERREPVVPVNPRDKSR